MKFLYYFILFTFFNCYLLKAQNNTTLISNPSSYQTGVPDISFSLFELQAAKDFNINLGLSYHPNSYRMGRYNGVIGRNWNLIGGNFSISMINTEEYSPTTDYNLYSYSINGESGYFKLIKIPSSTTSSASFEIMKLNPGSSNIEFEIEYLYSEPFVKIFKITDSKGYKYTFSNFDYRKRDYNAGGNYRSTFFISQIQNSLGNKIVDYTYKTTTKYFNAAIIDYIDNKLSTIETNHGKIQLEYSEELDLEELDKTSLKSITLTDKKGNFISKYNLSSHIMADEFYDLYSIYGDYQIKKIFMRMFSSLIKVDKFSNILEKTSFNYLIKPLNINHETSPYWGEPTDRLYKILKYDNPKKTISGILERITLPSGSVINYEFEPNKLESYIDKNSQEYINKIKDPFQFTDPEIEYIDSKFYEGEGEEYITFDTKVSRKYYINNLKSTDPYVRVYIQFQKSEIYPSDNGNGPIEMKGVPGPEPYVKYVVRNAIPNNWTNWYNEPTDEYLSGKYYVVPNDGSAYIEITGGGNGYIYILEKLYKQPPYANEVSSPFAGARIKKINYYKNNKDLGASNPSKFIEYNYDYFNKPNVSSGLGIPNSEQQSIIYQNVKVTESDKKGYTKYYYKTPFDYPTFDHPTIPNEIVKPYYNSIKSGLLKKQEVYDDSNNKKQVIETDYIFPEYSPSKVYQSYYFGIYNGIEPPHLGSYVYEDYKDYFFTTEQYPEKIVTKETSYDDAMNGLEIISEKTFDPETNNLKTEKRITADGTVTEAIYQYAKDKNHTKLLNANMHSIPLEVLHKTNNVEIGKIEMKFDHQDNFYPSSIRKYGLNNVINTEEKNDLYDDFGNILQKTSKTGIPTTYIYGYNSSLLIATIEGANYTQVMQALGLGTDKNAYKNLDIYIKSNQDIDESKEVALQQSLDQFRLNSQLKEYLITTYTYDPFIGMRSMTTPSGNKEYYFYDNAHQLIRIEDINHNIIKEFKYKYNLQP
ncbi:hypothetical protein EB1_30560 [Empedobacter brevis NBRC 14943 = ATCC 43319]|uniref:YD repeat-containing protein n=1 Tax=Empedobacter brevis NBRC 14943 = ATCC 43319 TaxID=1218108 RepID=A0A511NKL1_9FLAO|nr:hypothetical protein [Empedobacter brevis]GEM53266.1 hypothetical protein EB1_30560 [Empedobacter brevis NBRC 14943 = ATCC 43319]